MDYAALKLALQQWFATGPITETDTLLHVHAGMAVLLAARVLTGRPLSTPVPLVCVAIVQLANEVLDRFTHGSWRWPDTIGDTVNTLFWPMVLFVGLRLRKAIGSGGKATVDGDR